MSLRDHSPKPSKTGRRHRIDEILEDELDADDAEVLRSWLSNLAYSPEKISDELAVEGIRVVPGSIARYRYEVLKIGDRKR